MLTQRLPSTQGKEETLAQCSDCLFEGWNETYADPLPMEFADGKIRLTHIVDALSMTDQQEADKLVPVGGPLSCQVAMSALFLIATT